MNRTEVTSKVLKSWGYDPATQTLEIEFLRKQNEPIRRVYQYHPVPAAKIAEFEAADSKGSFFLKFIKPNYACKSTEEKVEKEKTEVETKAAPSEDTDA